MAVITEPRTGNQWGYADGADGWGGNLNRFIQRVTYIGNIPTILSVTNTPPSSPMSGAAYIIGASPTGAWVNTPTRTNQLAVWGHNPAGDALAWQYFTPPVGAQVYDRNASILRIYSGTAWTELTGSGATDVLTDSTITGNGRTTPLSVATPFTAALKTKLDGIDTGANGIDLLPPGGRIGYTLTKTALGSAWTAPSGATAGNAATGRQYRFFNGTYEIPNSSSFSSVNIASFTLTSSDLADYYAHFIYAKASGTATTNYRFGVCVDILVTNLDSQSTAYFTVVDTDSVSTVYAGRQADGFTGNLNSRGQKQIFRFLPIDDNLGYVPGKISLILNLMRSGTTDDISYQGQVYAGLILR